MTKSIFAFERIEEYEGHSLGAIMLNYWRSAAAIRYLVEDCYQGDVKTVFKRYQQWHRNGRKEKLTVFFGVEEF